MAMTQKQKDAYFAEAKKRGNISKGEIITPGSIVRGVAKVAGKVAGKQAAKKISSNVGKKLTIFAHSTYKTQLKKLSMLLKMLSQAVFQKC